MTPRGKSVLAFFGASFAVSVFAAEGCLAPTQLTLVIDTNVPCSELSGVKIVVASDPDAAEGRTSTFVNAETQTCLSNGRVGTLVVTPSDGASRAAVVVMAGVTTPVKACSAATGYAGCIVARRLVPFIEHTSLTVPILLEVDCLDVPCDAISTCSAGRCVSSETTCEGSDCSGLGPDTDAGGGVRDGGEGGSPGDAAADAPPGDGGKDASIGVATCGPNDPIACGTNGPCDAGGTCCQQPNADASACGTCSPTNGFRSLSCRSSANCGPSQMCCYAASMGGVGISSCQAIASCAIRLCSPACDDCPIGEACTGKMYDFFYCEPQ